MKPQAVDFSFVNKNIKEGSMKSDNLFESDFSLVSEVTSENENSVKIFIDNVDVTETQCNFSVSEPEAEEPDDVPDESEGIRENNSYAEQFSVPEFSAQRNNLFSGKTEDSVLKKLANSNGRVSLQEISMQLRKNFDYKDNVIPIDKDYRELLPESINLKTESLGLNHSELNSIISKLDSNLAETKSFSVTDSISDYTEESSADFSDSAAEAVEYDNYDTVTEVSDSSDSQESMGSGAENGLLEAFRAIYNTQSVSKGSVAFSFNVESDFSLNIERLVKIIESSVANNVKEVNLQLHPESLGKVTLRFTRDSTGVNVKISVREEEVRKMLLGDLQSLSKNLSGKGLSAAVIEISTESKLSSNYKDGRGQQNSRGGSNSGSRKKTSDLSLPDNFFKDIISE